MALRHQTALPKHLDGEIIRVHCAFLYAWPRLFRPVERVVVNHSLLRWISNVGWGRQFDSAIRHDKHDFFSACYGRQSYLRTSAVCSSGFAALTVAGRFLFFSLGWGTFMSNGNVATFALFSLWVVRIDTELKRGGRRQTHGAE